MTLKSFRPEVHLQEAPDTSSSSSLSSSTSSSFTHQNGQWYVEAVPLNDIAEKFGTPCYVYSKAALENAFRAFDTAFQDYPHHIHYAVKANSNLAVLNVLAHLGAGFDIVSQGELERVLKACGTANNIIFSGVGKTKEELLRAIEVNVGCIDVESESELKLLNELANLQKKQVSIALRVNPNIDSKSHPYISTGLRENKFGIPTEQAIQLAKNIRDGQFQYLKLQGLACHIGSQITELEPFLAALDIMLGLIDELELAGIIIETLNMGGGLGIPYQENETSPTPKMYVEALLAKLKDHARTSGRKGSRTRTSSQSIQNQALKIYLEPGRSIAATSGVLLTRVNHIKETQNKNFAIVDAGMNDLLRPALYHAYQDIQNVVTQDKNTLKSSVYDIVGPVCETADFLGKDRELFLEQGSLLAVFNAGAYGFSMSSNYNSRPRPPEILVDGDQYHVVRPRETYEDLFHSEIMGPVLKV